MQATLEAQESISYEIPVYKQNGMMTYFGGFIKHINLFLGQEGIAEVKEELTCYKKSHGTIQFSLDQKISVALANPHEDKSNKKEIKKTKKIGRDNYFFSFKASLISVRSFTSSEGSGGAAGVSSFLRFNLLIVLITKKIQNATSRKSTII